MSFLGITLTDPGGTASLGDFDTSGSGGGNRSYFCISTGDACGPTSFVNNIDVIPSDEVGITLVRTSSSATTPLPATLPLFGSGAGVLGFLGWRRKKKAAALAA